ncbi:MAG TPA: DUF1707 domain-containing protein [Chloroflexota bacterium]|jgi:hypothetical protein
MNSPDLRVGDPERRQTGDMLQQHYVEGRLSAEELAERLRQTTAARTRAELDAILRDLPPLFVPRATEPPPAAAAPAPSAPAPAAPASHRRGVPRDLRAHVTVYALTMLLLVMIWLVATPGQYFWPIWAMLGWGFAVALHAFGRRG